jgi:hypothetical protein
MTKSQPSSRPLSRRIQARVMGVLNIPMRTILRLPFATPLSGRLMLVFLAARHTRGCRARGPLPRLRPVRLDHWHYSRYRRRVGPDPVIEGRELELFESPRVRDHFL